MSKTRKPRKPRASKTKAEHLTPEARTLLHVLAVAYTGQREWALADMLADLDVNIPRSPRAIRNRFDVLSKQLKAGGWLESVHHGEIRIQPERVPEATDDAARAGVLGEVAEAVTHHHMGSRMPWGYSISGLLDELIRDLRIGLFLGEPSAVLHSWGELLGRFADRLQGRSPLELADPRGLNAVWIGALDANVQAILVSLRVHEALMRLDLPRDQEAAAVRLVAGHPKAEAVIQGRLQELNLYREGADGVEGLPEGPGTLSIQAASLEGLRRLALGDLEHAQQYYESALKALRGGSRKRNLYLRDLSGVFSLIPLVARGALDEARKRAQAGAKDKDNPFDWFYKENWGEFFDHRLQAKDAPWGADLLDASARGGPLDLLDLLLAWWAGAWTPVLEPRLEALLAHTQATGFTWLHEQARQLQARIQGQAPTGRPALVDLLSPKAPWEAALEALALLPESVPTGAGKAAAHRVSWLLSLMRGQLVVEARLHKRGAKGRWSSGTNVTWARLQKLDPETTDPDDLKVIRAIRSVPDPMRRGRTILRLEPELGWPALVGHPRLFRADAPNERVQLIEAEPRLRVRKTAEGLRMVLEPRPVGPELPLRVEKQTPTRWCLYRFGEVHRRMAQLLGKGIELPPDAEARLRETLDRVAPLVRVDSAIGGGQQLPERAGDTQPYLVLVPEDEGLNAQLVVRPLGPESAAFTPGQGSSEILPPDPEGQRVRVRRDLEAERKRAETAVSACPPLAAAPQIGPWEWVFPDPESALALVEALQGIDPETVRVQWPKGKAFSLVGRADLGALRLSLHENRGWFEARGGLRVDEKTVVPLQRLLAWVESAGSRYLPLDEGRFLALSDALRRRLGMLDALAEDPQRKPRYHPLTAPLLEELTEDLDQVETDAAWKERLARLRAAEAEEPEVPSTLSAELRDYQVEGFRWMMRLAAWGAGACLADDMGLGKTLQTLAVLVARAQEGPSLVVAPTSVCANWLEEAHRFAPTLRVHLFGPGDRAEQVRRLGPFDVVVASYGLMQQEIEVLTSRTDWNVVVLDEAQAIKNPATRRAQAACKLQAAFRVATTGTPVENHLGELWSLFRFLNPGLLGSQARFRQRFMMPIERDQNHAVRDRLRHLVRPFILRRMKSQVLDELPPRTEVVLHVEPSPEEAAFYEALRRETVEGLEREADLPVEQRRFAVLAALTRLRRAACNPRLIAPEVPIPSSKLALFLDVVEELREGRHKALVFSQFVDHLSLVREALDERGISYQYLDGATPARARAKRVRDFQAGQGDLFLISLKAGGTGLNLTAADYVIHLDPWWNPAAEDQASDRAHRIGQTRPVTVYRLVSRGTVEEQILELHRHKRDLADQLLAGTDTVAPLDADALMALLREGRGA